MTTHSVPLMQLIRSEIKAEGGIISFERFMQLALYHPEDGYYQAKSFTIGKTGDFTTAAEISPLYAYCFSSQCQQVFSNEPYDILELGAGTGRFACDLLQKLSHLPDHYYILEISEALRIKQREMIAAHLPDLLPRIIWLTELPKDFNGIMIANEVLDALPVTCFRIGENQIEERGVTWHEDQFTFTNCPPIHAALTERAHYLQQTYALPIGYESEINFALTPFIKALSEHLKRGIILLADYGYGEAEYYHPERNKGTLNCFYQHHSHANPLILPGKQDITAHVDFTQVAIAATDAGCQLKGYTTQAGFLLNCGLNHFAEEAEKGLSTADLFTLHQAIKRLTLPQEMGERVKIMALSKNIDIPLYGFKTHDRRRDL